MSQSYRRSKDLKSKQHQQHRVSSDPDVNRGLDANQRFSNLENDIVLNTTIMGEMVAQNEKYSVYLDSLIERERDAVLFWRDIRKRLATTGIIGAFGLILTVMWFATKEYISHL